MPIPSPTPPTARSAAALAADTAARVARRDPQRLAAALTPTARLRALLPGGPVEAHGRENVAACLCAMFADFDSVEVVAASGEPVADRHLIHYRLLLRRPPVRWVCTQTAICRVVEDRLAVVDLLCSGFREIEDDDDVPAPSGARLVG
ncbi:nuclear transport factor 2 family protein [Pseudonocardia sp.]|uniref:nuclear transport factor 2 family protein n=1 Tax=Pseudonocardia sp. TaxID=60912 RepID=UPI003D10AEDF